MWRRSSWLRTLQDFSIHLIQNSGNFIIHYYLNIHTLKKHIIYVNFSTVRIAINSVDLLYLRVVKFWILSFFINYYNIYHLPFKAYWLRDAPTGLTFNNCTLCPQCIDVFCIYLRTNNDSCLLHHKLIGFYNRDEKCLLRGTGWVFK